MLVSYQVSGWDGTKRLDRIPDQSVRRELILVKGESVFLFQQGDLPGLGKLCRL